MRDMTVMLDPGSIRYLAGVVHGSAQELTDIRLAMTRLSTEAGLAGLFAPEAAKLASGAGHSLSLHVSMLEQTFRGVEHELRWWGLSVAEADAPRADLDLTMLKPGQTDLPDPRRMVYDPSNNQWILTEKRRFDGPLFNGLPRFSDVAQNKIGDCQLLALLAALASTHPERLQAMITDNHDDTYTVRFPNGAVETVDGDLYTANGSPVGATPVHGLWPAIIEKAVAQHAGGYDHISGQEGFDQIQDLFTRTSTDITGQDKEQLWERLRRAEANHEPITAATFNPDPNGKHPHELPLQGKGLIGNHMYAVLGVDETPPRYVKLYNPHHRSEVEGAGANNFGSSDDGYFSIPLDEFMKNFSGFQSPA